MKNTTKKQQPAATYPEHATLSRRDTQEAIKLGWMNFDSLTPEGQADLAPRLASLEAHLADLDRRA